MCVGLYSPLTDYNLWICIRNHTYSSLVVTSTKPIVKLACMAPHEASLFRQNCPWNWWIKQQLLPVRWCHYTWSSARQLGYIPSYFLASKPTLFGSCLYIRMCTVNPYLWRLKLFLCLSLSFVVPYNYIYIYIQYYICTCNVHIITYMYIYNHSVCNILISNLYIYTV
jgi:hypothetical protein